MGSVVNETGRIMAIDYGAKRVGVAMTDPLRIIAQGAGTLPNDQQLLETLARMVREQDVISVVVGMPYAPDGGLGTKGKEVAEFVAVLRQVVAVPVETWDESFSTVEAHRALRAGGMKRKQRQQRLRIDEMAARLLLQDYLEHHN